MRSSSEFKFVLGSIESAAGLYSVLKTEVKSDSRVRTSLSRENKTLILSIKALDRNSFRSAINSYGRWIRLYEEIGGLK